MKLFKLMVLLVLSIVVAHDKTTHAELVTAANNTTTIDSKKEDNKTVIELNKDITVNTELNLDKALAELNGTASNIPKIRKVTPTVVNSDSKEIKNKVVANNATEQHKEEKTTEAPGGKVTKLLTEAGEIDIKVPEKNNTTNVTKEKEDKTITPTVASNTIAGENITETKNNTTEAAVEKVEKQVNATSSSTTTSTTTAKPIENINNNTTKLTTVMPTVATNSTTVKVNTTASTPTPTANKLNATTAATSSSSTSTTSSTTTSTTTTTTTTTTTSTTTTTTTTTPKPKKPTITYSIPDFPDLEKDNPDLKNLLQSSNKLPSADGPYAQPSQEFNNNSFHRGRDFIVPIVSMIFIIPLVIGILITSYRRFRDCWSTRHYRRMDFLVDGMYND